MIHINPMPDAFIMPVNPSTMRMSCYDPCSKLLSLEKMTSFPSTAEKPVNENSNALVCCKDVCF